MSGSVNLPSVSEGESPSPKNRVSRGFSRGFTRVLYALAALPVLFAAMMDRAVVDHSPNVVLVGPSYIVEPSFAEYYFDWGIVTGFDHQTAFALSILRPSLQPILGWKTERGIEPFLEFNNPTPFMFTIGFVAAAWVSKRFAKR